MTTTTHSSPFAAATFVATRPLALVVRVVNGVRDWNASRKQFRKLMALDDRMLADIGLNRGDLRAAEAMGGDPTLSLAQRARLRRNRA